MAERSLSLHEARVNRNAETTKRAQKAPRRPDGASGRVLLRGAQRVTATGIRTRLGAWPSANYGGPESQRREPAPATDCRVWLLLPRRARPGRSALVAPVD